MRADRDAERQAPLVDGEGARVRSVRRDADPHERRLGDPVALLLELLRRERRVLREDLEVDDRAQPELGGRGRGGAGEAVVGGGGDARLQRVGDAEPREREHVLVVEEVLARGVGRDPRSERLAVAEARVERVLEVRVRVDEARDDHRVVEVRRRASRRDLDDLAALEADAAAGDRRPVDGQHPVGGDARSFDRGGDGLGPPAPLEEARDGERDQVERRAAAPSRSASSPGRRRAARRRAPSSRRCRSASSCAACARSGRRCGRARG